MSCDHYAPVHPIDYSSTSQYLSKQVSCNNAEDYIACINNSKNYRVCQPMLGTY